MAMRIMLIIGIRLDWILYFSKTIKTTMSYMFLIIHPKLDKWFKVMLVTIRKLHQKLLSLTIKSKKENLRFSIKLVINIANLDLLCTL